MIQALVVDDEKRVRQGFISLTDWASYGIEIAGEAKDGRAALDALGERKLDLMFVDIGMPGMSGFELIEQARERYPWTKSVILTCYHEFDYVQEALRLGAIDYIVKTLLNKSNVDETMRRIVKRYARETRTAAPAVRTFPPSVVFCPRSEASRTEALLNALPSPRKPQPIGARLWCVPLAGKADADWIRELPAYVAGEWQPVRVVSASGMPRSEAEALIESRLRALLFYRSAAEADEPLRLEELRGKRQPPEAELEAAFKEWRELKWLVYAEDWKRFIERIEAWSPPPDRLLRFAEETAEQWSGLFGWRAEGGPFAAEAGPPLGWRQLKHRLSEAALLVQQRLAELSFSREVFCSLIRAVLYMKDRMGSELNQDEVARRVGMSRSYFSQCFKKFAGGELFGDALRKLRIERAQELLSRTEWPIRDIANAVGFLDEKYFSRVFREKTGSLPTEFRKAAGGGGGAQR